MGIVIAIDGPAGAGKGTLSRSMARELGLAILDTGLLYRAVALMALAAGADLDDAEACTAIARELVPADTARPGLRSEEIGQAASRVSAIPGVRSALFEFQRQFAAEPPDGAGGAVLDGRDIGTVICPDADLKIYLVADPEVRARRRCAEARAQGESPDFGAVLASITERDQREAMRTAAPMRPADDAVIIDTSFLTPREVLEQAIGELAIRLPREPVPEPAHGMAR